MILGGLQTCSFSNYPAKTAAVVFTQGCNFRCPFCHNGSLLQTKSKGTLSEKYFFEFLKKRIGLLDGVVISGGEPTLQNDLARFIACIKELGFAVKLDTNGSNPTMVEKLLSGNLIDYIAMDIKAPLEKYDTLCGRQVDIANIRTTISLISTGSIAHHFRTTKVDTLLTPGDILQIQSLVPQKSGHTLQTFIPEIALQAFW